MSSKLINHYFKTPNRIISLFRVKDFTDSTLKTLLYLLTLQNCREIHPSIKEIADKCNYSTTTINASLKWLKKEGFISVKSGKKTQKVNNYIINFDAIDFKCTQETEKSNVIKLRMVKYQ